jgi:hypothetical protein
MSKLFFRKLSKVKKREVAEVNKSLNSPHQEFRLFL